MQLHHVPIREHVITLDLLPAEARVAPDAGELEVRGDVVVNELGERVHGRACGQDERLSEVRLLPGSFV